MPGIISYDHKFPRAAGRDERGGRPGEPVLPQQADQQIRVNGLKIHTQIRGEPLLLYSGVWGDVRLWDNLLPHLRGFRTIAFDPPGIGRSQMAAWPLSIQALARLGIAVLDELGIDSAHVLGQSFGGALAQQTAIAHPARVRRLVLASTTFGGFACLVIHRRSGISSTRARSIRSGWNRWPAPCSAAGCALNRTSSARCNPSPGESRDGSVPDGPAFRLDQPAVAVDHQAPDTGRGRDDDPVAPLVNHQIMAALIPDASLHTVKGGGHMALLDSAAEIAPVITSFLWGGRPARGGVAALPLAS